MMSSKVYYIKDSSGSIWCYGYYTGKVWRVFNAEPSINGWFTWYGNPVASGFFAASDYTLVNNVKEKLNVSDRY